MRSSLFHTRTSIAGKAAMMMWWMVVKLDFRVLLEYATRLKRRPSQMTSETGADWHRRRAPQQTQCSQHLRIVSTLSQEIPIKFAYRISLGLLSCILRNDHSTTIIKYSTPISVVVISSTFKLPTMTCTTKPCSLIDSYSLQAKQA